MIPSLASYDEFAAALTEANSGFTPAEVHGLFCGLISATTGNLNTQWEKIIFGKKKSPACHEMLAQLYETSYHQMSDFSFEFYLLLPDDDTDINVRTEALGLWCQGFLTGLQQSKVPLQNREESDLTDALDDITEIAQVSFGDITETEEDEMAYFELVEYVRLAVLMIFQELLPKDAPIDNQENDNLLH